MKKMRKMSTLPAVLLALVFIGFTAAYFRFEAFRTWLTSNPILLDGWNGIAALSVFVFLFYTLHQFNVSQRDQEQQRLSVLAQRLSALSLEVEMNIKICDEILSDKEEYLRAASAPFNRIHGDMLRYFVTEGFLDGETLRQLIPDKVNEGGVTSRSVTVTLTNAYHYLLQGNDLIDCGVNIMTLQAVSQTNERTNVRLTHYMTYLVQTAEKLRTSLAAIKPVVEELEHSSRRGSRLNE